MSFLNSGPYDCACLARHEPRSNFDVALAERLILSEARRIFPGDSRRFEVRPALHVSIRDEAGPLMLHARNLVEILPERAAVVMTERSGKEGEENEGRIWRPNDTTVLMTGQYASNVIVATEGLLNMARVTPKFGGAEPVKAGDLKEFKDNLCAACGKQRWGPRSSGRATSGETK